MEFSPFLSHICSYGIFPFFILIRSSSVLLTYIEISKWWLRGYHLGIFREYVILQEMGLITVTISCPINTCVLFLNKRTNTKLPKLPSSSTSYDNTVTVLED